MRHYHIHAKQTRIEDGPRTYCHKKTHIQRHIGKVDVDTVICVEEHKDVRNIVRKKNHCHLKVVVNSILFNFVKLVNEQKITCLCSSSSYVLRKEIQNW